MCGALGADNNDIIEIKKRKIFFQSSKVISGISGWSLSFLCVITVAFNVAVSIILGPATPESPLFA